MSSESRARRVQHRVRRSDQIATAGTGCWHETRSCLDNILRILRSCATSSPTATWCHNT